MKTDCIQFKMYATPEGHNIWVRVKEVMQDSEMKKVKQQRQKCS